MSRWRLKNQQDTAGTSLSDKVIVTVSPQGLVPSPIDGWMMGGWMDVYDNNKRRFGSTGFFLLSSLTVDYESSVPVVTSSWQTCTLVVPRLLLTFGSSSRPWKVAPPPNNLRTNVWTNEVRICRKRRSCINLPSSSSDLHWAVWTLLLLAAGREDLLWFSVKHLAVIRLWLNVLLCPVGTVWSGWEELSCPGLRGDCTTSFSQSQHVVWSVQLLLQNRAGPPHSSVQSAARRCRCLLCSLLFKHTSRYQ